MRFLTAHRLKRPWIQLKWAESADGFMAATDDDGNPVRTQFSGPMSAVWMHRRRSMVDAIMVGSRTLEIDRPRLDCRHWPGKAPRRIMPEHDLKAQMERLYAEEGITSLMVEGGPTLLQSFIDAGLYDDLRIEKTKKILGKVSSPQFPSLNFNIFVNCSVATDASWLRESPHAY